MKYKIPKYRGVIQISSRHDKTPEMESLGHVYMDEEAYKLQLLFARGTHAFTLVFSCFPTSACVPQHVSPPLPRKRTPRGRLRLGLKKLRGTRGARFQLA